MENKENIVNIYKSKFEDFTFGTDLIRSLVNVNDNRVYFFDDEQSFEDFIEVDEVFTVEETEHEDGSITCKIYDSDDNYAEFLLQESQK